MIFKLLQIEEQTQSSNVPYPHLCCLKTIVWTVIGSYMVCQTIL